MNRAWWFLAGGVAGLVSGIVWRDPVQLGLGVLLLGFAVLGWRRPDLVMRDRRRE